MRVARAVRRGGGDVAGGRRVTGVGLGSLTPSGKHGGGWRRRTGGSKTARMVAGERGGGAAAMNRCPCCERPGN
jgi:hypothetical protein